MLMCEVERVADLEAVQSCLDIAGERRVDVGFVIVKLVQSLYLQAFVVEGLIFLS